MPGGAFAQRQFDQGMQSDWISRMGEDWMREMGPGGWATFEALREGMPGGKHFADPMLYRDMRNQFESYDRPILGVRDYAEALKRTQPTLNDYFGMHAASRGSGVQARYAMAADAQRRSSEAYNNYMGMRQWDWSERNAGKMATLSLMQGDSAARAAIRQQGRSQGKAPGAGGQFLGQLFNVGGTILGSYLGRRMAGGGSTG